MKVIPEDVKKTSIRQALDTGGQILITYQVSPEELCLVLKAKATGIVFLVLLRELSNFSLPIMGDKINGDFLKNFPNFSRPCKSKIDELTVRLNRVINFVLFATSKDFIHLTFVGLKGLRDSPD